MTFCEPNCVGRALDFLETLLQKERQFFNDQKTNRIGKLPKGAGLVTAKERDAVVRWLCDVARYGADSKWDVSQAGIGCCPIFPADTLCLAVAFVDQILTSTRVQSKYVRCAGLACFYIAAKLCEEPEKVPTVAEMVRLGRARYSNPELLRMESVILGRLNWKLSYPTIDKFLELMLVIGLPMDYLFLRLVQPSEGLGPLDLRSCLESILSSHRLMICRCADYGSRIFRPSLLALATLSLNLEASRHPEWLAITWNLQQLIKADSEELIRCREVVSSLVLKRKVPDFQKENVFHEYSVPLALVKSPRKRARQRSKGSETSTESAGRRVRTPPEKLFIDEIADSVEMLFG